MTRRDAELAAARHRVARIHYQIEKDSIDVRSVGTDARSARRQLNRDLDPVTRENPQASLGSTYDLVYVSHGTLTLVALSPRKELTRQRRCPRRRVADQLEALADVVVVRHTECDIGM